jgi:hypothetical protein
MEEILGKITRERAIPGTRPEEAEKVRYVSFDESQKPSDIFESVVWKLKPPMAKNGGVNLENFTIIIPDGTRFYALKYHGDVPGWQKQIETGAGILGVFTAKIESDTFVLSDGRSYPLSVCTIERG